MHIKKFFIGCNLRFEEELELELKEIWPFLLDLDGRPHSTALQILQVDRGGILIEAPWHLGLQINSWSKIANRVLARLLEFRVRDFPKLHNKLVSLKNEPLIRGKKLNFEISASKSRLNHEGRIREICEQVFNSNEKQQSLQSNTNSSVVETIFIRMYEDLCSVSLDTTGELLYLRSNKSKQSFAPIRESLAAFCLRKMTHGFSRTELGELTLIDPMMGSGTFLKEADTLYQRSLRKDFSFQKWAQTPALLKSVDLDKNDLKQPSLFHELWGFDHDSEMVKIAQDNLTNSVSKCVVKKQDVFQSEKVKNFRNWIISNPPYGERIEAKFDVLTLFQQLIKDYNPEQLGLVLSENQSKTILRGYEQIQAVETSSEDRMHLKGQWAFSNGGILVRFVLFSRFVQDFETLSTSFES